MPSVLCRNQVQNLRSGSPLLKNFLLRCPVTPAMFSISSSGFWKISRLIFWRITLMDHLSDPISKHIGFVDMPASAGAAGNQFSGKCKLIPLFFLSLLLVYLPFYLLFPQTAVKSIPSENKYTLYFCCNFYFDYFFRFKILVASGAIFSFRWSVENFVSPGTETVSVFSPKFW